MVAPYSTSFNLIIVAIDRYVAVIHPMQYETKMTDAVVNWVIAIVWLVSIVASLGNVMWLINADLTKCVLIPAGYNFMGAAVYTFFPCLYCFSTEECYTLLGTST
jgi:7 transmembrane receptor (rhodopsin family)